MPVRKPRLRIVRRLGVDLPGLTRKTPGRRTNPPGQHGAARRPRRPNSYRQSLEEKQDGTSVDRPSYEVKPGAIITMRSGPIAERASRGAPHLPSFLTRDGESASGQMIALPSRADAGLVVDDTLIIAFYAR